MKLSNNGLSRITRRRNLESRLGGRYSRPSLWWINGFSRNQQQITKVGYCGQGIDYGLIKFMFPIVRIKSEGDEGDVTDGAEPRKGECLSYQDSIMLALTYSVLFVYIQ
jgi:hypothetical protein